MKKTILHLAIALSFAELTTTRADAFGIPGIPNMLGGGGGGMNALTEQAKVKAVDSIFTEVGKGAFEGGKMILSKQKWACDKLTQATVLLAAINQPSLSTQANTLRTKLFCDYTGLIPAELLAPEAPKEDSQKT